MDSSLKPSPTPFTKKSKLAKTFQRVIHLNKSTKPLSKNTAFCLQLAPHETKPRPNCFNNSSNSNNDDDDGDGEPNLARNRAAAAAFVAQLFAAVSAVKAAYADLQTAQAEIAVGAETGLLQETDLLVSPSRDFAARRDSGATEPDQDVRGHHEENEFSILDDIVKLFDAGPGGFTAALRYAVRSVRCFVKVMVREMESSNWDISPPRTQLYRELCSRRGVTSASLRVVCVPGNFDGFDSHDFSLPNEPKDVKRRVFDFGDRFKELKAVNPVRFLKTNPVPGLGSSDQEVDMFQVERNCRFSEVYMESVNDNAFAVGEAGDVGVRVAFTVVPGFKIGKAVIQAQVYLLPAVRPDRC
ncbi:hypothetical protein C3L33_06133, partial [Rhododendron williamsianum]